MEKQKLWKLKRLEATDEMLELAGKDIPIITNVPYEKMEYPTGLYVRTELEDNILKVGIFFAEILASGGRRPSYTLFINPKKECFTSYDYRLKKWTDRMLDKLDFPKGSIHGVRPTARRESGKQSATNTRTRMYILESWNTRSIYGGKSVWKNTGNEQMPGIGL